jgi:hypothetical protein
MHSLQALLPLTCINEVGVPLDAARPNKLDRENWHRAQTQHFARVLKKQNVSVSETDSTSLKVTVFEQIAILFASMNHFDLNELKL